MPRAIIPGLVAVASALAGAGVGAHKPVTSKFTYNEHVFPIFRDRCAGCHVDGGIAPMSLVTYKSSVPWAESIREEIVSERMPPWFVENRRGTEAWPRQLTAAEIDTIVTWATGGTPEGDPNSRPPIVAPRRDWPLGAPDVVITLAAHEMAASALEEIREYTADAALRADRWVRAIDLLPGSPSIVRSAVVSAGAPHSPPERPSHVVAVWTPGESPTPAPDGSAFRLMAGGPIKVRVRYRKPWQLEGSPVSDCSAIGLYFTERPAPGGELREFAVDHQGEGPGRLDARVPADLTVVAVRPSLDRAYEALDVSARRPDGSRVVLLRLTRPLAEWPRRYWLDQPQRLTRGSVVEVAATAPSQPGDGGQRAGSPAGSAERLQVFVDYVSRDMARR